MEYGLSPEYVLDRMEMYEIRALLKHKHLRHREEWERTRMLSFIIARCAGAKIEKIRDIFALPWDEKEKEAELDKEAPSAEEQARLHATARYLLENGLIPE